MFSGFRVYMFSMDVFDVALKYFFLKLTDFYLPIVTRERTITNSKLLWHKTLVASSSYRPRKTV